jgi:YVTN family beta-propeller protein
VALLAPALTLVAGLALAVGLRVRSDAYQPTAVASQPTPQAGDRGPRSTGQRGGIYAAATSTRLSAAVRGFPERVYVPNSGSASVDVIDPATFKVVDHYPVGTVPHHVTPAWDMGSLYVDNTNSNSLTQLDPQTGRPERTIGVTDPYNLYFTPDGRKAIVVAERYGRLDFRDPHSWKLIKSVPIPWPGIDHLDFSANGRYLIASTEYSGRVVKVDAESMRLTGALDVGGSAVDVKLAPDGSVFYVANQDRGGVSVVDPEKMKEVAFLPTGAGAHGLAISRDARSLYVSNRVAGTISVIDLARQKVARTWRIGGSPDMLQVSPDGRELWASGRYDSSVYVVDTRTGRLLHSIQVGPEPHGLTYFPQPGRFSIGHNGVYR